MGRRKPCIDLLGQLAQGALYVVQVKKYFFFEDKLS